jgi:hypothetical protein
MLDSLYTTKTKIQKEHDMIRTITLKTGGKCAKCGHELHAGGRARWTPHKIFCLSNAHHGHATAGEYRARINIATGTVHFEFAMGKITDDERDARLADLLGGK